MNNKFKFFSLVFSYPSIETLSQIRSIADEIPHYRSMAERILTMPLEDVQTEYTKLFVTDHPRLHCPPYESYYREGTVYGNSSVEVRELYEKFGLEYSFEGEPPDHISVELEFLSLTEDLEFARRMMEWVPEFARRVKESSVIYGVFAEELVKLLSEFVNGDF